MYESMLIGLLFQHTHTVRFQFGNQSFRLIVKSRISQQIYIRIRKFHLKTTKQKNLITTSVCLIVILYRISPRLSLFQFNGTFCKLKKKCKGNAIQKAPLITNRRHWLKSFLYASFLWQINNFFSCIYARAYTVCYLYTLTG